MKNRYNIIIIIIMFILNKSMEFFKMFENPNDRGLQRIKIHNKICFLKKTFHNIYTSVKINFLIFY